MTHQLRCLLAFWMATQPRISDVVSVIHMVTAWPLYYFVGTWKVHLVKINISKKVLVSKLVSFFTFEIFMLMLCTCKSALVLYILVIFFYDAGQHTLKINKFKKIQTKDVHLTMSKTRSSSKEKLYISKRQLSTTEEKTKAFDEASEASKSSKFPNFLKVMNTSSVIKKFFVVSFYFYFLLLFLFNCCLYLL